MDTRVMVRVLVIRRYTPAQGDGWAVETYDARGGCITESRWTTRERAVREGDALARQLGVNLAIY